jgi:tetratricopeptide (TPR) repeat protein
MPCLERLGSALWVLLSLSGVAQVAAGQTPPSPATPSARPLQWPTGPAWEHKQRGDRLARAGRLEQAAIAYRAAIANDPNLVVAYNELGNVYFAQGKFGEAVTQFQEAVQRKPNYHLARYNLAYALRKAGRFAEAALAYRAFLKARPGDPDGHFGLGETLKALGDRKGAVAAYRQYVAIETRPSEIEWVRKAKAEIVALEAAAAVSAAPAPAPASTPSSPPPALPQPPKNLPLVRAPARKVETPAAPSTSPPPALPPARRVDATTSPPFPAAPPSPKAPPSPPASLPPAALPQGAPPSVAGPGFPGPGPGPATGSPPQPPSAALPPRPIGPLAPEATPTPPARPAPVQADRVTLAQSAENSRGVQALLRQAETAFQLRDYAKARQLFETTALKAPGTPEIHYKLGVARAASGDLPGALQAWETVTRLDPANKAAQDLVMRTREKLGLVRPESYEGGDPRARGDNYLERGRALQALRAYDLALRGATHSPELLLGRARALMDLGRYPEAVRTLLDAVALQPTAPLPYYHLGTCLQRLGDKPQALHYFRLFLSLADPDDAGVAEMVRQARRWLSRAGRQ